MDFFDDLFICFRIPSYSTVSARLTARVLSLLFPPYIHFHSFLSSVHQPFFISTLHPGLFCWLTLSFNIFFPFLHPSPLPWCLPHPNSWVCVSSAVRQRHHITWQVGRLTLSCTSWDPHCSLANPASVAG